MPKGVRRRWFAEKCSIAVETSTREKETPGPWGPGVIRIVTNGGGYSSTRLVFCDIVSMSAAGTSKESATVLP
jgi:hypothetical protein